MFIVKTSTVLYIRMVYPCVPCTHYCTCNVSLQKTGNENSNGYSSNQFNNYTVWTK